MFGDGEYVGHPEQEDHFQSFMQTPPDLVVLVGSSGAVPTNDYLALHTMERGAKVININLDSSTNSIVQTKYYYKPFSFLFNK
jgi:NAD-dependent SIR2 family protein deacetylase